MVRRNGARPMHGSLRHRLESCKSTYSTVDDIVNHLRSTYPDYHRVKHQTLTRLVQRLLNPRANHAPKRIDEGEGRLAKRQALHLRKRMHGEEETQCSASMSCASSSTSEDAIYDEPGVDLMKTMLRRAYTPTKDDSARKMKPPNSNEVCAKKAKGNSGGRHGEAKQKEKAGPRFSDFGGMNDILKEVLNNVIIPMKHPVLLRRLGSTPINGILLHGPPGCGKTTLAQAIANETGFSFYQLSATELVSGVSGGSEENIRELFNKAYRTAPSIIFIDEIDSIASQRENLHRATERGIVTQLLSSMDESSNDLENVLVIAATNRPDALDSAFRRPGRFDWEIFLDIPDEASREHILSLLTGDLPLEGSLDLKYLARSTSGFVGADLKALVKQAGFVALRRHNSRAFHKCELENASYLGDWWKERWPLEEDVDKLVYTMSDFQEALKIVQPSLTREGFSSVPNEKWEDVGGLDYLREEFKSKIILPIKYPEAHKEFGMASGSGVLLFGPPGCGKTLIAKAIANEAKVNFIHIKGPELVNKFVGESERQVRLLFTRARACSPCIIFFDEVDSLSTKRDTEGGSGVVERIVAQLLVELDGAQKREGVFVIGATNRPDKMDEALLRPGRFGQKVYIPLPSFEQRFSILKVLARKRPVDSTVDLRAIAKACENFSGADVAALVEEAARSAFLEKVNLDNKTLRSILPRHFDIALKKVSNSVSPMERRRYEKHREDHI